MRATVSILFNEGVAGYHSVKAMLERIDCLDGLKGMNTALPGLYQNTFDEDDRRLSKLKKALKDAHIDWVERLDYHYSVEDLRAAELLLLEWVGNPVDIGRQDQDVYDLTTGCPICHTAARQKSCLKIAPVTLSTRKHILATTDGFFIVGYELRKELKRVAVKNLHLEQVSSPSGRMLPWWQLATECEMPPVAPETKGYVRGRPTDGCHACKRDNWFITGEVPTQIAYKRSQLPPGTEMAKTYERFGISSFANGYLAQPQLLITPRFSEILLKVKMRRARFVPVRFI